MGADTLIHTAFDAAERLVPGARFREWLGWSWAAGFGDAVAEHHAVRTACGVWDESPLQKWQLTGADALTAADRFFTNDMRSLQPGQLRYGAFCDDEGRMIGDGTVLAFSAERCMMVTALPEDGEALLEAAAGLEFELVNRTLELPHLQLQGPASRALLERLCGRDLSGLRYYRFLPDPVEVAGAPVLLVRCGRSGELGYELYCDPGAAERLWEALTSAGARPYGLDAAETLRQESGLILIGAEYAPGVTDPYEVNLDHVVRLEKQAFRGREALARIAPAPPRRLVTLLVEGDDVPRRGAAVFCDGRLAGEVRSASRSPTLDRVIALAVIESSARDRRPPALVETDSAPRPAAIAPVPVYDPGKLRPRA